VRLGSEYTPLSSVPLTDTQRNNLVWMQEREQNNTMFEELLPHRKRESFERERKVRTGGILADKTGSGKTRTMLEHIRRSWLENPSELTLILVPPTIIV
jgi:hypothetical protein